MKYTLKKNSRNIKEFLEQKAPNKNKIAITTDLDEKYNPVIEELGFKHTIYAYFTSLKTSTINREKKLYIQEK